MWEHWLAPDKLPVAGKRLADLFPSAEAAGVLQLMREVCATAQPKHLKGFKFTELGAADRGNRVDAGQWDWEIYPLSGPHGVTHLLNVIMDVSAPKPRRSRHSRGHRLAENRRREEASGVLRIFGVAPEMPPGNGLRTLSEREYQVAELLAMGFTNGAIADHLKLSPATVSSHVAHILSKLGFRSRAQVAAGQRDQDRQVLHHGHDGGQHECVDRARRHRARSQHGPPRRCRRVENHETWEKLETLGCDLAQGYYLCPPMPPADLTHWFRESSRGLLP